ncbi:MAG: SDR family NAD(P)-dependent oxidoreductase [Caulobacter sp.]|nr:SDR family NAD(P)-dependent oxidoreductase [Caulobacter sp.]
MARPLALITGASSGIGEAFAQALAARGYDLALVARRVDRLEALAAQLSARHGVEAFALPMDLSVLGADAAVLAAIDQRGRHVDMLVNNAGYSIAQSFADVAWMRQRDFLMTLVVNPCGLAHRVIGGMVARGRGRIINTASLAGFAPGVAGHSLYPGAKSLMISFSQALAAEYGPAGLKVTAVCPGFTRTEFAAANGTGAVMDEAPRRLFQTPQQVVDAALKANDAGRVVVIPGWYNALAAALMRLLPMGLVRAILMQGSKKYHLDADS